MSNQTGKLCRGFLGMVIFLICFLMLCGCASATVSYNSFDRIITVTDEPVISLTQISNTLNNPVAACKDGTIWYVNGSIRSIRSNVYINDSDGAELRLMGNRLATRQLYSDNADGIFTIDNITLASWNNNTQQYAVSKGDHFFYNVHLNNVTFQTCNIINVYGTSTDIEDIYCYGCKQFGIQNAANINIRNVYMENSPAAAGGYAFLIYNSSYINFENITSNTTTTLSTNIGLSYSRNCTGNKLTCYNAGNYKITNTPSTGSYGLIVNHGGNNTIKNVNINFSSWGGLAPTGWENGSTFENITVNNSGHNGIDLHPAFNISIQNFTVGYTVEKAILLTGGYDYLPGCRNCTFKDGVVYGSVYADSNSSNIIFDNLTSSDYSVLIAQTADAKLINITTIGENPSLAYFGFTVVNSTNGRMTTNGRIIDSLSRGLYSTGTIDAKVLNSEITQFYSANDLTIYQYLDMIIINGTGSRIPGALVNFTNEINATKTSTDRFGTQKTSFNTNNGRTYLPLEDSFNSPALPMVWYPQNLSVHEDYTHTAAVSTSQGDVTLTGITPAATWRRSSQNDPDYTLTAIINSSTDTHFIGYMPSMNFNNFSTGDSVKFQVWANEPLTQVVWKKDGVELQNSTSTTYEATISDAPITVEIIGESANGSISKTWLIDPEQVIDPTPDHGVLAPVANFTANTTSGTYPLIISFTDGSENTPTHWYWDFDNDGVTDSTEQNATFKYKVKGNYTVKLVVSNANNTDSETKTAYINVTGTAPTKRITHTIWGYFYNMFYQIFGFGAMLTWH